MQLPVHNEILWYHRFQIFLHVKQIDVRFILDKNCPLTQEETDQSGSCLAL